jgi:hypothetical protein
MKAVKVAYLKRLFVKNPVTLHRTKKFSAASLQRPPLAFLNFMPTC